MISPPLRGGIFRIQTTRFNPYPAFPPYVVKKLHPGLRPTSATYMRSCYSSAMLTTYFEYVILRNPYYNIIQQVLLNQIWYTTEYVINSNFMFYHRMRSITLFEFMLYNGKRSIHYPNLGYATECVV